MLIHSLKNESIQTIPEIQPLRMAENSFSGSSSISSSSSSGYCGFLKSIYHFFEWLFKKIFCMRIPREITPIPKEIDDYWNGVIQFNWTDEDVAKKDPAIGHYFADRLALACKLAGLKECCFEKIFAKGMSGATSIWFTGEQIECYGDSRWTKEKQKDLNHSKVLFIAGIRTNSLSATERERHERAAKRNNPNLANAEFYYLTEDDVVLIRDSRELPDDLRKFLTEL